MKSWKAFKHMKSEVNTIHTKRSTETNKKRIQWVPHKQHMNIRTRISLGWWKTVKHQNIWKHQKINPNLQGSSTDFKRRKQCTTKSPRDKSPLAFCGYEPCKPRAKIPNDDLFLHCSSNAALATWYKEYYELIAINPSEGWTEVRDLVSNEQVHRGWVGLHVLLLKNNACQAPRE